MRGSLEEDDSDDIWEAEGLRMPFRSKWARWAGVTLLALLSVALFAGCGAVSPTAPANHKTPNMLDPKGPVALRESDLWWIILIIGTFVFVVVTTALIIAVVRFRDRPGAAPARQFSGNTRLELAWTIAPSIVLFAVLAVTIGTMFALAQPTNQKTITVTAVGHQWWFEFQYPNDNVVVADELHVPVGTVVHVDLRSDNVIHSFWIPQLAGKTDMIPGHANSMWFKADVVGQYRGECAEFCGTQHAHMDFLVIAQTQADYNAWLATQKQPAQQPQTAQATQGKKLFISAGCAGCHYINGVNQSVPTAQIGPNLTHFGNRDWIAGGVLDNTPQNLYQWVYHAQSVKNGSDMPSFDGTSPGYTKLTPTQVDALVAYLEGLK